MSVLQKEVNLGAHGFSANENIIKEVIADQMWGWFYNHREDKLFTINFLFIHKKFTVNDAYVLFELLFGAPQARVMGQTNL